MAVIRELIRHMTAYAAPHGVTAVVLAAQAAWTFTPGGEAGSRSEAVVLHLFISALLLICSAAGYLAAIAFAGERRTPVQFAVIVDLLAGAFVIGVAGVGGVHAIETALGVSSFFAAAVLGLIAGMGALLVLTVGRSAMSRTWSRC